MATDSDLLTRLLDHPDVVTRSGSSSEVKAWCPWHDDKVPGGEPNLGINVRKGIVKCFSCGNGGVKALAKKWGIVIEKEDGRTRKSPDRPFMSNHAALKALADIYGLREETISHFRIEASEKTPSPGRTTRGAWKYPTAAGNRFKAFDRSSKPKYWWTRGTDKNKMHSTLYGLSNVEQGTETVYLVNGEPAVWVCWQLGIPAVCSFGENNLHGNALEALVGLGVSHIRQISDLDRAGDESAFRNSEIVRSAGLEFSDAQLPDYLGDKADVCDLYSWHRFDDSQCVDAIRSLPERPVIDTDPLRNTRFFEKNNKFWMRVETRNGETLEVPLTNFTFRATEEVMVDDGWEQTLHVNVTGKLDTGQPLPEVKVPASKVLKPDWIAEKWGIRPIIYAGKGNADKVREIMQRVSVGGGFRRRTIYSHTGWRKIGGRWTFLMPGDMHANDDIEIELSDAYKRYDLPRPPSDPKEAIAASLRFLKAADHLVTIPMLAFAYLAPLQSILHPSFTLWVRASSGSFKSTLTALLLSHYGAFEFNTPSMTWEATARAIERHLFDLKDCLAWLDDFNPRQSEKDMNVQNSKADTVIRSLGNLQGRGRMRQDTTLQNSLVPRALLVSTGEIYPSGESVIARTLAIDYNRGDVDIDSLTEAQRESGLYAQSMASYISWVSTRYEGLQQELPIRFEELRALANESVSNAHARTPAALACMQIAIETLSRFVVESGAFDQEVMGRFQADAWTVFLELSQQQHYRIAEEGYVDQFLNTIDSMLVQTRATFHRKGDDSTVPFGTELLGWFDEDAVYLQPDISHRAVSQWLKAGGRSFTITQQALRKLLFEKGLIVKPEQGNRLTHQKRVNGRVHRVLQMPMEKIPFHEYFEKRLEG